MRTPDNGCPAAPRTVEGTCFLFLVLLAALLPVLLAALPAQARGVSFQKEVAPILFQKCHACHHAAKIKGDYRLDSYERLLKPGASGLPPVVPGRPAQSELFRLISTHDPDERMPQKDDPLSRQQISLIQRWISDGATFDGPDPKVSLASLVLPLKAGQAPPTYARPVPVVALAFSPDGKQIAAGGYHEITLWDPQSGKLLSRIPGMPRQVLGIAYAPSGTSIFVAGGTPGIIGQAIVVNPITQKIIRSIDQMPDMLYALALSPDGRLVAVAGVDGVIRIHDAHTGRPQRQIEQHSDWIMSLSFSPDGQHLVSASRDKSSRVFNLETGVSVSAYLLHQDSVLAAAFSPDNKTLYSAGRDKEIHVWNPASGEKIATMPAGEGGVLKLLIEENYIVVAGADARARQYRTGDRTLIRALEHEDMVTALAGHPSSNRLATATHRGRVRVWNIETGALEADFLAAPGLNAQQK